MSEVSNEPSMEEILSSIKRIIAEEGEGTAPRARPVSMRKPREPQPLAEPVAERADEVLELTEPVAAEPAPPPPADSTPAPAELVSPRAATASRDALASLSAMVVKPDAPGNTLEGLVREMLKPMLKEWLDAHLPELVEKLVAREIARISGKGV